MSNISREASLKEKKKKVKMIDLKWVEETYFLIASGTP